MKMRVFILTLFLSFCFSGFSQTDPFQEKILNYFIVNGMLEECNASYNQRVEDLKYQFRTANVPDEVWSQLTKTKKKDVKDLMILLSSAFRKNYTETDIENLTAFYKTDAGQNLAYNCDIPEEQQKEIDAFLSTKTGKKIKEKETILAEDIAQIFLYWKQDVLAGIVSGLIKKGYRPQ